MPFVRRRFRALFFSGGESVKKGLRLKSGLILPLSRDQTRHGGDGQGRERAEKILETESLIIKKFLDVGESAPCDHGIDNVGAEAVDKDHEHLRVRNRALYGKRR